MNRIIVNNTPVEAYTIASGHTVYVKREDLSTFSPAPPFSKVRGLLPRLQKLKAAGYTTIGYTETAISMAGWGVAWACRELGLTAVIYDPQYIPGKTPKLLDYHREQWDALGATRVPIPAGRAKVGYYLSKRLLWQGWHDTAILLPLGLPFEETITETAEEARRTEALYDFGDVVVNVGSGTICAGVLQGLSHHTIYGVMGRTGSVDGKAASILKKAQMEMGGLLGGGSLCVVDPGWEYTEPCYTPCPFPSHPWYDRKAWAWLVDNIDRLRSPVLFWNIGSLHPQHQQEGGPNDNSAQHK